MNIPNHHPEHSTIARYAYVCWHRHVHNCNSISITDRKWAINNRQEYIDNCIKSAYTWLGTKHITMDEIKSIIANYKDDTIETIKY